MGGGKSDEVRADADGELSGVAVGRVDHVSTQLDHTHAAYRANHAADRNDGTDCTTGKMSDGNVHRFVEKA